LVAAGMRNAEIAHELGCDFKTVIKWRERLAENPTVNTLIQTELKNLGLNLLRNSHLFAETKDAKRKVSKKMYHTVKDLHHEINGLLKSGYELRTKAGKKS
jgi:hypothetical protein